MFIVTETGHVFENVLCSVERFQIFLWHYRWPCIWLFGTDFGEYQIDLDQNTQNNSIGMSFHLISPLLKKNNSNCLMWQTVSPKSPKKFIIFSIYAKMPIANIFKRWHLVGKKVLYKSPNNIASLSLTLHAINRLFLFWQITQMAIAWTLDPKKMLIKFRYCYTFMPIYGSKFQNLGVKKIWQFFDISKIST